MNIIKNAMNRLNGRLTETNNPCKAYKTELAAEKAAESIAVQCGMYFMGDETKTPDYFIMYSEKMKKFVPVIMMNKYFAEYRCGGFIGFAAHKGYWCG